ncbi:MAG: VOC family protein [Gemmatimonadota bacterium]|nr:VOC family protein [Gemmatimonadota bacterium]
MVKTHGLTHISLAVRDAERSLQFYQEVLGVVVVYRDKGFIQAQTPGSRDVLVFLDGADRAGEAGGVSHFGFRLVDAADIDAAAAAVALAGGKVLRQGEVVPGEPYIFFADPDGYEIEIWYEPPTPGDPPAAAPVTAR